MNSIHQSQAIAFAKRIKALGFRVFLAENREYGLITNDDGSRVISFSFSSLGSSLSGNYGPPSRESGTGWRLSRSPESLRTVKDVQAALAETPPAWCGKGWRYMTTLEQHLKDYGASSRYYELQED